MNKFLKMSVTLALLSGACIANGKIYQAKPDSKLFVKISKGGINRISTPPYQIVQVTGDDSSFHIKHDADGNNVYLMPLKAVGEKIEISIKNNVGFVQDVELEVANINGQSINIDSRKAMTTHNSGQKQDIAQMLKSMQSKRKDKFYVQDVQYHLDAIGNLDVKQIQLYKWQDLAGGVFVVTNNTNRAQELDVLAFIRRFDNVVTSFTSNHQLEPKEFGRIFVIQKIKG